MTALETRLKEQARALGFELVGIAAATPADGFARLRDWLARGFAGSMAYMQRHAEARREPSSILPEVRSVVMLGMNYPSGLQIADCRLQIERGEEEQKAPKVASSSSNRQSAICNLQSAIPKAGHGKVARYARGPDYHDVLRARLKDLLAWLQAERPGCRGRGVVDTAPLLERDYARRAGLGWFGKNTMLINKRQGSYFFLAALLTDVELRPDLPHSAAHCGTCTACLDACPTEAFAGPGLLDARRCISYLTIELRGPVPEELRPGLGDWVFGCDICQEVCPWNRHAPLAAGFPARSDLEALDLIELLGLSEEAFRQRFRGTALTRPRRAGLLRNAALVLGNTGGPEALPALRVAAGDADDTVREAAAWARTRIEERLRASDEGER